MAEAASVAAYPSCEALMTTVWAAVFEALAAVAGALAGVVGAGAEAAADAGAGLFTDDCAKAAVASGKASAIAAAREVLVMVWCAR